MKSVFPPDQVAKLENMLYFRRLCLTLFFVGLLFEYYVVNYVTSFNFQETPNRESGVFRPT